MLELNIIRKDTEAVKKSLAVKGFVDDAIVDRILALDAKKRKALQEIQAKQNESNALAKSIGKLFQAGEKAEAEAQKARAVELKDQIKQEQDLINELDQELQDALVELPNLAHSSVPSGNSEEDNKVIKEVGEIPILGEKAKPHWELMVDHQLVDLELGTKITGAGFPLYRDKGARLQRALINFFLDEGRAAGYTEYIPPFLVNEDSAFATGQLPDKEGQMYHATADNFFLIPTAEVPLTNIFRDTILKESDFPVKLCGHSPCFRREAGSYGKEVRGLNRVHQFEKVEIVQLVQPQNSYAVLDEMVEHVGSLLSKLELPYRILQLCGGDLSFASALTYDFEVFSAAQKRWLEVSSVSNFETFQSNRMKLRYKGEDGKTRLAHTLNGSALALPRIFAALLENFQQMDGSIGLPKVLHSYTGFEKI